MFKAICQISTQKVLTVASSNAQYVDDYQALLNHYAYNDLIGLAMTPNDYNKMDGRDMSFESIVEDGVISHRFF